jgi:chlorophyllide a reductase subunit Y
MRSTELADPEHYDAIVIINLCVPTASGVPLRLLPKQINGVRIIGIDVPGFGVPTHAEAKDVLAGAMLKLCPGEAEPARCRRRAAGARAPDVALLGEMFPADPVTIGGLLEPLGLAAGPVIPNARMARTVCRARLRRRRRDPSRSTPPRIREFSAAGRPIVGSGPGRPRRNRGMAGRDRRHLRCSPRRRLTPRRTACCRRSKARSPNSPIKGRITDVRLRRLRTAGGRLLVEAGADVRYVGTACPRTEWSEADREWLAARGIHVQYRASLEQDVAAFEEFQPDLVDRHDAGGAEGQGAATPALYFTNLISARPLIGPAGAGSLARSSTPPWATRRASTDMLAFFEGVGTGNNAGIWTFGHPSTTRVSGRIAQDGAQAKKRKPRR